MHNFDSEAQIKSSVFALKRGQTNRIACAEIYTRIIFRMFRFFSVCLSRYKVLSEFPEVLSENLFTQISD